MKLLIVVAGVPRWLKSLIGGDDRKLITENQADLLLLAAGQTQAYPAETCRELLEAMSDWVESRAVDERFGLHLFYAAAPDEATLLEAVFPFCSTTSVTIAAQPRNATLARTAKNALVRDLARARVVHVDRAKIMQEHLIEHARTTPFLLPPVNFGDARLIASLHDLGGGNGDADDLAQRLGAVRRRLINDLPKVRESGRRYFAARNLLFVPPGDQGHAIAKRRDGCSPRCLLAGRVRLGASFNPRFHYDCRPVRGSLAADYASCHGQRVASSKHGYVNIAPNDFIR